MQAREYAPGEVIAGAYRVLRVFDGAGASGMGVVYLVDDREAPRPFVLKACQVGDPTLASRFAREAEVWVGLGSHPNVTQALWVRHLDDQLFVAAEYVDGSEIGRGSLADVLGVDVGPRQVLRWIVQFCSGLSHALAHGLIAHRDVKPANLLLSREGNLKIADFGLGRLAPDPSGAFVGPSGAATGIVGTIPYMAPEQIRGTPTDHRCDIYAFGIVLYQLCSRGAYPYKIDDPSQPAAYVSAHLQGTIHSLTSPFWPLISRCLARSASARWQSPDELAAATRDLGQQLRLPCPPFIPPQPSSLEELYVKAQSLSALGKPEEALSAVEQYLRQAPDAYWAWTEKGRILMSLDRNAEAEQATRRSLTLDAGNSHAWNNLGVILKRLGRHAESCEAYEHALECDPMNTGAMMNAAQPLCEVRRFDRATELLCTALRLVPSKQALQFNAGNLAGLMLQARAFQPAEEVTRALIRADTRNSQAWHNLGVLLAATRRPEEALRCVQTAVECEPDNTASRFYLVHLCVELRRPDEGLTHLDYLITHGQEVSKAVCLKAQLLAGNDRGREGIMLLENHLRHAPEDDPAWFILCRIAEQQGDLHKALRAARACEITLDRQGEHADQDNVRWARAKVRELRTRLGS